MGTAEPAGAGAPFAAVFSNAVRHDAPGLDGVEVAWAEGHIAGHRLVPPPGRHIPSAAKQLLAPAGNPGPGWQYL
ncbi:MAG TPA: hypothetical protein VMF65_01670 [Acidimicrobiales bacterium]|nr:hypothetical protein [Acidimicrobiales bacterium]